MNLDPRLFTNTTKAQVLAAVNAGLALLPLFGVLDDPAQFAGVAGFVNALAAIFTGATYKNSPTRMPDEPPVV